MLLKSEKQIMSGVLSGLALEATVRMKQISSNWYWYLIAGIVFLVGGLLAFFQPVVASLTVEAMVAWFFIFGGILQAIQLFRASSTGAFFWSLALGVLFIVLGVVMLMKPFAGLVSLTMIVASLLGVAGVLKIVYAFKIKPISGWIWLLVSGIISLVLAVVILFNLGQSAMLTLGILLAIELINSGIWLILLGFNLRSIHKELKGR